MIRKAVIPAAGFGTRFLPATKSQPKEMLPIVDTPTIQYVVEEAVNSGIRDILIITRQGKQSIENHFDRAFDLEASLRAQGREEQLQQVRHLASLANIHFVRQAELNGLGDAISYARWHVGNEPFLVLLGDTLIHSKSPCSRQLIDSYNRFKCPIIGVEEVARDKVERYGIVGGKQIEPSLYEIDVMVEKPKAVDAPSNLAIGGRYILPPEIFDYIERTPRGVNNEIQLTDALRLMLKDQRMLAHKFDGVRYDIGNRFEYMKTSVIYAAERPDMGPEFRAFLRDFVGKMD
ncbi:MAG TPA: UTP--glucose-1-phosphate uridylyltransferase GalU [Candidatus Sumerlaeota bacterium]|nr:UTP--glucose-1-phosphate uridylyltransferase GalU [Candidatus Sumerlaeota bacterium]HPS02440.1 UTP--glucose-1-phosphate uridylyltransferase GalU [Candidatus Sumerlaeota bacterium]